MHLLLFSVESDEEYGCSKINFSFFSHEQATNTNGSTFFYSLMLNGYMHALWEIMIIHSNRNERDNEPEIIKKKNS